MFKSLFKKAALAVIMAMVASTALEARAVFKETPDMIIYSDAYVRIVITGEWEGTSITNKTITFVYPRQDRVSVNCECVEDGWQVENVQIDERVAGGYVSLKMKCLYNSEATHEVELKFRATGKLEVDLDCDADWDGDIDEDDDPIEDSIGALVGLDKTAPVCRRT